MKLVVFDFDDVLVRSYSRTKVTHKCGSITYLLPSEFAVYDAKDGDEFDFSEFHELIDHSNIDTWVDFFHKKIDEGGTVVILSARPSAKGIDHWLNLNGRGTVAAKALKNSSGQAKADWIEGRIKEGYTEIEFYDDAQHCIDAVYEMSLKYPNIKWTIEHVKHS